MIQRTTTAKNMLEWECIDMIYYLIFSNQFSNGHVTTNLKNIQQDPSMIVSIVDSTLVNDIKELLGI